MRRFAAALLVVLVALTGCGRPAPSQSPEEFFDAVEALDEVTSFDRSGDPWVIEIDPDLTEAQLEPLGTTLFDLANDTRFDERPRLEIAAGPLRAPIEFKHDSGGPQPGPAELRWLRWIDGLPIAEGNVEFGNLHATLDPGADPFVVMGDLFAKDLDVSHALTSVSMPDDGPRPSLEAPLGDPKAREVIDGLKAALDDSGATLVNARTSGPKFELGVRDHAHAVETVQAVRKQFPDADALELTLVGKEGGTWRGSLDALTRGLDGEAKLAAVVAETGATLRHTDVERPSYSIEVPDVDAMEKVVELVTSGRWIPGPESSVRVQPTYASNEFGADASLWRVVGPIVVDAHRSGLPQTSFFQGSGGSHERTFDIRFMEDSNGPDLRSPDGYRRIVEVLRRHDWDGDAQIELGYDEHLIFWSTADGKARDAYNALHGRKQKEPYGWAADFLKEWDATATK